MGYLYMIKVSIIVPVYNVDRYLNTCMDSILAQTLKEIEILCVDDGSTDGSGELLDDYAKNDNRVKVLHRNNAGYGAALNAGIDIANGEYIGIVESDDMILPDMFESLYQVANQNELDFVKSDAIYWHEKLNYKKRIHYDSLDTYYNQILNSVDRNIFFDFFMNVWTGIYNKEFLLKNDIRFNESPGASYQDNGFWLQTMMYANKVLWLNEAFYLYRQDNETASVKSKDKVFAMTKEFEYVEKLLKKRGQEHLLPYCNYYKLVRHRGNFIRIADEYKKDFCKQIQIDYELHKATVCHDRFIDHWLRQFCVDDLSYFEQYMICKKNYIHMLEKNEDIIIYGAGKIADKVCRALYNQGIYGRVRYFAVTNETENSFFAGRNIVKIEEAIKKYPQATVVIAVREDSNAGNEMKTKLCELGVKDFLFGDHIDEYIYVL